MAETKTRTQKKGSSGRSKSGSGSSRKASSSRGSAKKTASRSKGNSRSKSSSSRASGSKRSRPASRSRSGGASRSGGNRTKNGQGQSPTSGGVLEKAKGPATMAGAALLGVAGGIAAVRNGGKRRSGFLPGGRGPSLKLPSMGGTDLRKRLNGISLPKSNGSTIGWVEEKARGLGDAGYRVADLTSEARRLQKGGDGE